MKKANFDWRHWEKQKVWTNMAWLHDINLPGTSFPFNPTAFTNISLSNQLPAGSKRETNQPQFPSCPPGHQNCPSYFEKRTLIRMWVHNERFYWRSIGKVTEATGIHQHGNMNPQKTELKYIQHPTYDFHPQLKQRFQDKNDLLEVVCNE